MGPSAMQAHATAHDGTPTAHDDDQTAQYDAQIAHDDATNAHDDALPPPPPPLLAPAAALASYDIAQRVSVRVISLRHSGGRLLVGLSPHLTRLNPALDSADALAPSGELPGGWHWGRVLLVEGVLPHPNRIQLHRPFSVCASSEPYPTPFCRMTLVVAGRRATVSLELPTPYELPQSNVVDGATLASLPSASLPSASLPSAGVAGGGAPKAGGGSLRRCLAVGQLLRVAAVARSPTGRLLLGARLGMPASLADQAGAACRGQYAAASMPRLGMPARPTAPLATEPRQGGAAASVTASALAAAPPAAGLLPTAPPAALAAAEDDEWSADAAMARVDAGAKRSWLAAWENASDDESGAEGEEEDEGEPGARDGAARAYEEQDADGDDQSDVAEEGGGRHRGRGSSSHAKRMRL